MAAKVLSGARKRGGVFSIGYAGSAWKFARRKNSAFLLPARPSRLEVQAGERNLANIKVFLGPFLASRRPALPPPTDGLLPTKWEMTLNF